MRKIKLTPKKGNDSLELSKYVRDAYNFAYDLKSCTQDRIFQTDAYFKNRDTVPDVAVHLCDSEDDDCETVKAFIHMDAISDKIDAFMAVSGDAIVQVDKPWVISPTVNPKIPEQSKDDIIESIIQMIGQNAAAQSGGNESEYYLILSNMIKDEAGAHDFIRGERDAIYDLIAGATKDLAKDSANELDRLLYDDVQESNWDFQLSSHIYNMAKYDFAVMKAPLYVSGYKEEVLDGRVAEVQEILFSSENIHPANYFCSEDSTWDNHGTFEIDISSISMNDLEMAKSFDGFVASEIDECIEYFYDNNRDWAEQDYEKGSCDAWRPYEHIAVIKYYGKIDRDTILEHCTGAQKKEIMKSELKDNKSFECEIWVIGDFVVYQTLSLSGIIRRPFKVSTYSKRGSHKYQGKGIYSICIGYQLEMDKFYNLMLKNADLAAGGIIGYDRKKIQLSEFEPSDIKGGLRVPVKSSAYDGGNNRPIFEIRFDSHVSEFFGIISQIEEKMDKRSQIPSSSVGFGSKISSIRSTGIASLNQQAIHKSVIMKMINLERSVIKPMVRDAISYHLWNTDNKVILNGAVDVVVEGYSAIIRKEQKQQNLDLFIQNIIGIQNAVNQMKAQGQDVSGIISLTKKYTDQAGFDGSKFFSETPADIAGGISGQVDAGMIDTQGVPDQIVNDGRVGIDDGSSQRI